MPILNVKTTGSEQIWASPDGQRKIYKLTLDYEGKPTVAKTFSDAIARVGWEGTVEIYPKEGKFGTEDYVRQPPKENPVASSAPQGSSPTSPPGTKFQSDPFTMYLSYAKDLMVARIAAGVEDTDYVAQVEATLGAGYELYNGRPGAEPKPEEASPVTNEDLNSLFSE